jgi:hypothetical protein
MRLTFTLFLLQFRHIQNLSRFPASHSAKSFLYNSTIATIFGTQSSTPTMNYTVVSFETRKPELSPAEFEDYYDNVHVHVVQEAMGSSFPKSHVRYCLKRQSNDPNNVNNTLPLVFIGSIDDVDYDAIVIMTFENQKQLLEFQSKYWEPDIATKIGASAEKFIVQSKQRVVGLESPHATTS